MSLHDAYAHFEAARTHQVDAEDAGDLITALYAQRTAKMWWGIIQKKIVTPVV